MNKKELIAIIFIIMSLIAYAIYSQKKEDAHIEKMILAFNAGKTLSCSAKLYDSSEHRQLVSNKTHNKSKENYSWWSKDFKGFAYIKYCEINKGETNEK